MGSNGSIPYIRNCTTSFKRGYYVVELPFNGLYSEDKMEVLSYQIVEGEIWLIDFDGTMLREFE